MLRRAALTSIGVVLLTGCLSVSHTPYEPNSGSRTGRPNPIVPGPRSIHEPVHAPAPIELTFESAEADYTAYRFSTPSDGYNRQPDGLVTGRYFEAAVDGPRPLVIVLPIWATSNLPQRATLNHLLEHEEELLFDVLALDGANALVDWEGLWNAESQAAFLDTLGAFVEVFTVTVRDIRRLIDWGASRPQVDAGRIALVGFSASAVVGAMVVATEPRLAAAVLVFGGGRPHEIMASCPRRTGRARSRILAITGWSEEEYAERLEPVLADIDPVRWASSVEPSKVLFIDTADDECMPPPSREDLWEALGRPERITLPFNHIHAFLTMSPVYRNWTTRKVVEFVEESLLGDRAAKPADTR
jgi:pimeloyl-ACP methyl ester carboxylesterase